MVLFNYSTKELTAKVVYYGPGLCGKTTNLQYIHGNLPANVKGKMLSLATKTDRTLFFDFLPIDLGHIRGMKTRVQLYTVPGQVFYNETRKLVLKGADGIVFVADSQKQMLGANVESFKNLEENLKAHGLKLAEMPHVLQFNKRDLPKLATIEELNASINRYNAPFYESVATTGIGVQDTLKAITKLVLVHLTQKYDPKARPAETEAVPATPPAPPAPSVSVPPAPEYAPSQTQRIPVAAVAPGAGETQAIPLSIDPAPSFGATVGGPGGSGQDAEIPSDPAEHKAPTPRFDEGEINDLVDEVEEVSAETASVEAPAFEIDESGIEFEEVAADLPSESDDAELLPSGEPDFEVDRRADPEWSADGEPHAPQTDAVAQVAETAAMAAADRFENGSEQPEAEAAVGEPAVDEPDGLPGSIEAAEAGEIFPAAEVVDPLGDEPEPEPELGVPPPEVQPEPTLESVEPEEAGGQEGIELTELATDQDLFEDPSLEVATVEPGVERAIVVPVELGETGTDKRRFKLTIQLRLDPVD